MAAAYNFGNSQNNNHSRNYIHQSSQSARTIDDEDDDRVCRSCHSHNLRVDWAQGDRVCTDCGVVDESHILDDRPEWKDFGEAEDLVKGLPSGARSGLVVVDESKYLGGLQPTILSKHVYGNCPMASATTNIRKSLNATNRKMDRYMEKEQKRALQRAKLSLALKRKQIDVGEESDVRPEHDAMLLHEEQESERAYSALFREKWSLQRALLLHGHDLDDSSSPSSSSSSILEERAELVARLDKTLKRASYDLYTAYTILQHAAQRLELAPRIVHQATNTLCRYAAQKDGLTVKGVASRLSESQNDNIADDTARNNAASSSTATAAAEAAAQLKAYNRQKQMAALASALLFVEARKQGHARPLQEVCAAFEYPAGTNSGNTATDDGTNRQNNNFIKPKHCSKAMKELRILFPEYTRATAGAVSSESSLTAASQEQGSDNFVEHATRKLELPPVATASIQILVEELQGKITETKMSTTCAAVTLLVCTAGAIMQRLARQAMDPSTMATKRLKTGDESNIKLGTRTESGVDVQFKKESTNKKIDSTQKFDTFLHPAASSVVDNVPSYEMRQMWDAWTEQMPWGRSLAALEQAFHISKPAVLEFFRTKIYPQRVELLSLLQESTKLRATPRATVLLSQMCSTASPLLNSQGKVV